MTHTPGPWSVVEPDKVMAGKQIVARVAAWHHYMERNARLIAAAPGLLEMLQGVVEGIEQAREPHWSQDQKQAFLNGIADAARAAIALAKGETQ